ncbi:hypothetical protein [Halomonas sp. BC2]|uniref:hypothetical protein n=1 Tax=Halomonas sp. BC2 TaxID=1670449 RepID=UPI0009BE82BB|nr:hypothetical protein [Halomonas sp. BC2]
MDETLFRVNGVETTEIDSDLDPATVIHIEEGIVASLDLEYIKPLTAFISAWQKKQNVRAVAIDIPQEIDDKTLRAHLKTFGAKLI